MAKIILATGLIVAYGYSMEGFMAWYGGNKFETSIMATRMMGPYAPAYWALIFCNVVVPQVLWFKKVRTTTWMLFIVSIVVNLGMWLERFIIVVTSLHRDFLPSSWGMYYPTFWDISTYFGTIGLFLALFFVFIRIMPMISIYEMSELVTEQAAHAAAAHAPAPMPGESHEREH
jgi:molybdopterin-containing oxidoreductase family membrane subunit